MNLYCSHCGMEIEESGESRRYFCISCQKYREFFEKKTERLPSQLDI